MCNKSDELSFEKCKKSKSLIITRCHAGLIEATAPLLDNNTIIGYIMFGQITDNKDRDSFIKQFTDIYSDYNYYDQAMEYIKRIKYKKTKQIYAAAKILDACTSYIQIKEMVGFSDYNYFLRVFKKRFGISPKKYKNNLSD